ncbi:MAG TPA: amidase [Pyrinomonadaceae bacterium]|jgi:amidase|nr:amidase [Pyrinomonadaceae bacterium]
MDEIIYASATELARAIREREVSSAEVVEAHFKRIAEVNPKVNAIVLQTEEAARSRAKEADEALARGEVWGPLHGVPVTIKDAFEMAGVVAAGGTKGRAAFVPAEDATGVKRYKEAGAVILGKTNTPEISLAFESDNLVYGRTKNPYDASRTAGGSSGGEAAAIASGMSPLGLGSDAGGSIRLPAHFCGIAGIKPTSGRTARTGHFPPMGGLLDSVWQIGPLARKVEDLALALPLLCGNDWRDPTVVSAPLGDPSAVGVKGLRVAFHTDNGVVAPTEEVARATRDAARVLRDAGAEVVEACPPVPPNAYEMLLGLYGADNGAGLRMLLMFSGTDETHALMTRLLELLSAVKLSAAELTGLVYQLDASRSQMLSFMRDYDLVVCPPCAREAMPHGTTFDDDNQLVFVYTMLYNLTGWPGVVVRAGSTGGGIPVGAQLVARPWREDVALACALEVERALGGWQKPPL